MANESLIFGWIAPHGVVPDMPDEHLRLVPGTDAAMREAAQAMASLEPDAAVIVAPHGFRAADANTVSLCKQNSCCLSTWYPWRSDEMTVPGDPDLARGVLRASAESGVPTVGLIYGATSAPSYPMDWSITAPMSYLLEAGWNGPLLPVTFSQLPFESEWRFGRAIGEAIRTSGKRVALIASSDLSHVHSADGPYGVDPIAPEFDGTIQRAVRENDIASLQALDPEWVSRAAQDGLRSMLILGGAMEGSPFTSRVLGYEVLIYFGMLTAVFEPAAD